MNATPLLLLPGIIYLSSCVIQHEAGPMRYDSQTVDAEGAEMVHVELHMGAGDLRFYDGAQHLARADFSYNIPSWKPRVRYSTVSKRGTLVIRQPEGSHTMIGNTRYRWDLQLSNKIPMDLEVHFGAGQARLDVGSLQLRGVELHMGVGQADLDLRGPTKHSYDVNVHGGVGEATIRVPSDAGIYAEAHGGIGSIQVRGLRTAGGHYESDSYGRAENQIRIQAHGGIGTIRILAD